MYQTNSGYTLELVYLLVFGSPVAVYLNPQSKLEDRDEKMASKMPQRWLVLFRGGYLWSHRPACLPPSHQRSTDPARAARPHTESRHPSFFKDPSDQPSPDTTHSLISEVASWLDEVVLYYYYHHFLRSALRYCDIILQVRKKHSPPSHI